MLWFTTDLLSVFDLERHHKDALGIMEHRKTVQIKTAKLTIKIKFLLYLDISLHSL